MNKRNPRVSDLPPIPSNVPPKIRALMEQLRAALLEDEAKRDAAASDINKETDLPSEEDINSLLGELFSTLKKDIQSKEASDISTQLHPVMNYITPSEAVDIMNHITKELAGPLKGEGKPFDAFKSLDFLVTQVFSIASEAAEIRDAE